LIDLSDFGPTDDLLTGHFEAEPQQQRPLAQRPQKAAVAARRGVPTWLLLAGGGVAAVLCLAIIVGLFIWSLSGEEVEASPASVAASASPDSESSESAPEIATAPPSAATTAPAPDVATAPSPAPGESLPMPDTPPEAATAAATTPAASPGTPPVGTTAAPAPAAPTVQARPEAATAPPGADPNAVPGRRALGKGWRGLADMRAKPNNPNGLDQIDTAIVLITITDAAGQELGLGTGFVIDPTGLIATNHHVVKRAHSAFVQFSDGTRFDVVGYRAVDPKSDLAILELKGHPQQMKVLTLSPAPTPPRGSAVNAVGHPDGPKVTITKGTINNVLATAQLPDAAKKALGAQPGQVWIETSATVSSGNGGGPLVGEGGEVIGVNTWVDQRQNLGFAMPVGHLIELKQHIDPMATPLADANTKNEVGASFKNRNRQVVSLFLGNPRTPKGKFRGA